MTGVGIVAALYVVVAPFLFTFSSGAMWSNVIAAVVAAAGLLYAAAGPQRYYVVALAGLYLVVSSFFFAMAGMGLWLNVLAGIALAVVGYMGSRGESGTTSAAT